MCYGWVHASCEGIKKVTIDCWHKLQLAMRYLSITASFTSALFILKNFKSEWVNQTTLSESLKTIVKE